MRPAKPSSWANTSATKPVILVLAYYRCPMLCTQVLNGLTRAMLDMPFDVGKEFQVVTVSFDPRETPELAAAKKKTYVERYGRPGAAKAGTSSPASRRHRAADQGRRLPLHLRRQAATSTPTPAASWC